MGDYQEGEIRESNDKTTGNRERGRQSALASGSSLRLCRASRVNLSWLGLAFDLHFVSDFIFQFEFSIQILIFNFTKYIKKKRLPKSSQIGPVLNGLPPTI